MLHPATRPITAKWTVLLLALSILVGGCSENPQTRFLRQVPWIGKGVWLKVDTHIHTQFSDGRHDPELIAAQARRFGCDAIAITDHADRDLQGGTPAYVRAVQQLRESRADLIVIMGLEWNLPPYGGDEHVTVLFPNQDEGRIVTQFRDRFDDLKRNVHHESLAVEGLRWLKQQDLKTSPVLFLNHPSRKQDEEADIFGLLSRLRTTSEQVVGFSGAPGHQGRKPFGSYDDIPCIDRWDPAAAKLNGVWDQLLANGKDLWAARAPSDFHNKESLGDLWPGEFSETWVYAPQRSIEGVLEAMRAGTFFANHGWIVRQLSPTVEVEGLERPAHPGEVVTAPVGTKLRIRCSHKIPATDWQRNANSLDEIELIAITKQGAEVVVARDCRGTETELTSTYKVPQGGVVFRIRVRSEKKGENLWAYTNSIRIVGSAGGFAWLQKAKWIWLVSLVVPLLLVVSIVWVARSGRPSPSGRSSLAVRSQKTWPKRWHLGLASLFFGAIAAYGSMIPLNYHPVNWSEAWEILTSQSLMHRVSRSDVASNVLLTIPISFFLCGSLICDRRSLIVRGLGGLLTLAICGAFSIGIELSQFAFEPRIPSKLDIIAQWCGATIGTMLWFVAGTTLVDWARSGNRSRGHLSRMQWVLQAYLIGLLIYSVLPLDLTLSPGDLWTKVQKGRVELIPFQRFVWSVDSLYAVVRDCLIFFPVGMLTAIWRRPTDAPCRAWPSALIAGMAFVVATETAQLFVMSRHTSVTDAILGTIGAAMGIATMRLLYGKSEQQSVSESTQTVCRSQKPALLILLVSFGWVALILMVYWTPWELIHDRTILRERFEAFVDTPFTSLYKGGTFYTGSDFLRKVLIFAPLGMAVAFIAGRMAHKRASRRLLTLFGLALVAAFAAGVELVQIALLSRTPSLTDAGLYLIGAIAGLSLISWITRSPE